jgi:hypothetical protein
MPLPPKELTTLAPKPAVPAANADDLVFAQFLDNEGLSLDACYATHQQLVDWVNKTHDTIATQQAAASTVSADAPSK